MIKALSILLLSATSGCAVISYEEVNACGERKSFVAWSLLADDRIHKLVVSRTTKTTTQGLGIGEATSEVSEESIEAIARGAAEGAVRALKGGMVP